MLKMPIKSHVLQKYNFVCLIKKSDHKIVLLALILPEVINNGSFSQTFTERNDSDYVQILIA